jgi:hypothetical protein
MKFLLLLMLCFVGIMQLQAQKKLTVQQQESKTSFFPEENKACVEFISPLADLNIKSTFGEQPEVSVNEDGLHVYRFVFDLADEMKRTLFISAPGFVREELKLSMSPKQRLYYTVFPPDESPYRWGMTAEYLYSGTAPVGARLGIGKRFGLYASFKRSDVKEEGFRIEEITEEYDTKGSSDKGYIRESYTAGVSMGLYRWCFLHLGGGFGKYGRQWESKSGDRYVSDFQEGPEVELGVSFRLGPIVLSGGANALIGDEFVCDYTAGIGFVINFQKKKK